MSEAFLPGDLACFANFRSVQGDNVVEFIDVMVARFGVDSDVRIISFCPVAFVLQYFLYFRKKLSKTCIFVFARVSRRDDCTDSSGSGVYFFLTFYALSNAASFVVSREVSRRRWRA